MNLVITLCLKACNTNIVLKSAKYMKCYKILDLKTDFKQVLDDKKMSSKCEYT